MRKDKSTLSIERRVTLSLDCAICPGPARPALRLGQPSRVVMDERDTGAMYRWGRCGGDDES
jgi:hypothetical protein